jgi:hypothetical protein
MPLLVHDLESHFLVDIVVQPLSFIVPHPDLFAVRAAPWKWLAWHNFSLSKEGRMGANILLGSCGELLKGDKDVLEEVGGEIHA